MLLSPSSPSTSPKFLSSDSMAIPASGVGGGLDGLIRPCGLEGRALPGGTMRTPAKIVLLVQSSMGIFFMIGSSDHPLGTSLLKAIEEGAFVQKFVFTSVAAHDPSPLRRCCCRAAQNRVL